MARIRYIKPEFFTDEELAAMSPIHRLAFAGLWCLADKLGRLEYRPKFIKAMLFPYEPSINMEKILQDLASSKSQGHGFIQIYEDGYRSYIQIINWSKHQKPHHTEKESILPSPTLMEKGMGKGMENQLEASCGLSNGVLTVKEPLKDKQDKILLYLHGNICKVLEPYRKKIVEFYHYREKTPVKGKVQCYKSEKGIDGLLRECKKCIETYADLNECLDVTMQREWLTPDPGYLQGKVKERSNHPRQEQRPLEDIIS